MKTQTNAEVQRCQDTARQSRNLNRGIRVWRDGPEGTSDNSPAFQRWVWVIGRISPEGTAEAMVLNRPFGTWRSFTGVPALKRWAIINHPSGIMTIKSWRHWTASRRYGRLEICATSMPRL